MESTCLSAQDKLDQMLEEGKINDEDYLRLSSAIKAPPDTSEQYPPARAKLVKIRDSGIICGLCAGYAQYFGIDAWVVRTIWIIASVLFSALTVMAVIIIPLLYISLSAFIPWDNIEKTKKYHASGNSALFITGLLCFYVFIPLIFSVFCFPHLIATYHDLGIEVWSSKYQSTWAGRAIDCTSAYGSLAREGDTALRLVATAGIALITLVLFTLYNNLCSIRMRRYYTVVLVGIGLAWTLFLLIGSMYPLIMATQPIH